MVLAVLARPRAVAQAAVEHLLPQPRRALADAGHAHIHVRGYQEEGTTTTPFDMVVMNDMDRFHLVMDVIDRVPGLSGRAGWLRQQMTDTRTRHRAWTREHGDDLPEVRDWIWAHE